MLMEDTRPKKTTTSILNKITSEKGLSSLRTLKFFSHINRNTNMEKLVALNRKKINIRYADGTIILANMANVNINTNKTKYMITSANNNNNNCQFRVNGQIIGKVSQFVYLGTTINEQWDYSKKITCRTEKGGGKFIKVAPLLKSHNKFLNPEVRMLRCYVFSVLFYDAEAWTRMEYTARKLQAFEM